jgi:hypothetical protein
LQFATDTLDGPAQEEDTDPARHPEHLRGIRASNAPPVMSALGANASDNIPVGTAKTSSAAKDTDTQCPD